MRRIALLITVGLLISCTTALGIVIHPGTRQPSHRDRVDSCLREHGWPYGRDALRHVERRVSHPNGLVMIFCKREASRTAWLVRWPPA
jgi:hypothetical protein